VFCVSWYRTTKSVIDKPIRIASQKIPAAAVMRSMAWADLTCMKNHATSSAFAVAIARLIAGFSAPSGTNALPSGVSRSAISAIQTATAKRPRRTSPVCRHDPCHAASDV